MLEVKEDSGYSEKLEFRNDSQRNCGMKKALIIMISAFTLLILFLPKVVVYFCGLNLLNIYRAIFHSPFSFVKTKSSRFSSGTVTPDACIKVLPLDVVRA
jgi:hypothetical protein